MAPWRRVPKALPSWDKYGQVGTWEELRVWATVPRAGLPAWVSSTLQASAFSALGPGALDPPGPQAGLP